jgi:hypoxanthine phosphoribosyltransferase
VTAPPAGPVAIPRARLLARVAQLADGIADAHPGGLTLVALLPEARALAADLAADLDVPCRLDAVEVAPYRAGTRARLARAPLRSLRGRAVVAVAAVVDTGLRLRFVLRELERLGAREVSACVLLDRRDRRLCEDLPLEHVGFRAPDALFVGYGLGAGRGLDHLPDLRYADAESALRIRRLGREVGGAESASA